MTLSSAYIELFIRGEKSGGNVGGKCPDTILVMLQTAGICAIFAGCKSMFKYQFISENSSIFRIIHVFFKHIPEFPAFVVLHSVLQLVSFYYMRKDTVIMRFSRNRNNSLSNLAHRL